MSFGKSLFSSILGTIIGIVVLTALFFLIIQGIVSGISNDGVVDIKEKTILYMDLNRPIVERGMKGQEINLEIPLFGNAGMIGLNTIKENLTKAKNDDEISGVFLNVSQIQAASSTLFDIREALIDFKEGGKWIVAYSEVYTQGSYYLSSVADEIYLYPEGGMDWSGLSADLTFFKGLLDELEIDVQVLRGPDNKYKSAVEPFLYEEMSEPNREQFTAFLGDIWRIMLEGISTERNISIEKLNLIADSLSVKSPIDAQNLGFVDGLKYHDEVMEILKNKIGVEDDLDQGEEDIDYLVSLSKYKNVFVSKKDKNKEDKKSWEKDRIAVVYAVGPIGSGEGDDQNIGSERIARALRNARYDDKVKAVVLRVNSPGGSALASDVIWRETKLIQEAGKPFIVSMGDVAASGGYYIACGADAIYANANTITGSIGVFGMIPNMKGFFNNKLHLSFDGVETNEHASLTVSDKLDAKQLEVINKMIFDVYDQFTSLVAEGRGMTQEEVDNIGQGRVWSGEDAKEIGLIDEIGGLDEAVAKAAEMAGIENYKIHDLPKLADPFEELMKELSGESQVEAIKEAMLKDLPEIKKIMEAKQLLNMKGVQARLPYYIDINL